MSDRLQLGITGFTFHDLFVPARLCELDARFRQSLAERAPALATRYEAWRSGESLAPEAESELLVECAGEVAGFVARLFGVEREWEQSRQAARDAETWLRWKDEFVKRRALKRTVEDTTAALANGTLLLGRL